MTNIHDLRKGQRVRLIFDGVLALEPDMHTVSFKDPQGGAAKPVNWSPRLTPSVKILDEGWAIGDLAQLTDPQNNQTTVAYMRHWRDGLGWYDISDGRRLPMPLAAGWRLKRKTSFRIDPDEPPLRTREEPVKPAYVPQLGDIGLYTPSAQGSLPKTVMWRDGFGAGWFDARANKCGIAESQNVKPVMRRDGTLIDE